MGQRTYQVSLRAGEKATVTVTTEDPDDMKESLAWARQLSTLLAAGILDKGENEREYQTREDLDGAPICAVHHVPMVRQRGKFGEFWSCHERNADGSFCSYKPDRPDAP